MKQKVSKLKANCASLNLLRNQLIPLLKNIYQAHQTGTVFRTYMSLRPYQYASMTQTLNPLYKTIYN